MENLNSIIESLLFVAEEPLTVDKLRNILETVEGKEIRQTLQDLSEEYEQRGGGFRLQEVAGGWQIRSRPEYHEWIKRMLQPSPQRLSRAALETLAVIAYKQPIIRADIEHIRGVDCGGVLRQLMERKIIRVLGRKEIAGRPLIYATTKLFLEMFDLKDLNDLPTPKEIADFGSTGNTPEQPGEPDQGSAEPVPLSDGNAETTEMNADETDALQNESTGDTPGEAAESRSDAQAATGQRDNDQDEGNDTIADDEHIAPESGAADMRESENAAIREAGQQDGALSDDGADAAESMETSEEDSGDPADGAPKNT